MLYVTYKIIQKTCKIMSNPKYLTRRLCNCRSFFILSICLEASAFVLDFGRSGLSDILKAALTFVFYTNNFSFCFLYLFLPGFI